MDERDVQIRLARIIYLKMSDLNHQLATSCNQSILENADPFKPIKSSQIANYLEVVVFQLKLLELDSFQSSLVWDLV